MLKSYGNKIETVEHNGKTYIKSRCIDTVKPNVLTLRKQSVLKRYFFVDNKKTVTDYKFFQDVCKKLAINEGLALNFLTLQESLLNLSNGNAKSSKQRKFKPNQLSLVIAVNLETGKTYKANSVSKLSSITGMSSTSIYKSINENRTVKNVWRCIGRHHKDSLIVRNS